MDTLAIHEAAHGDAETGLANTIRWRQLWSLAALYASIIVGWIAYENYQPRLLIQFDFTSLAFSLAIVQALILIVTPLISGKIGDRYRFHQGHRLPIISSGISFAAMVFMAVAFTLIGNPGEIFRWVLPVLIIFWLIAMSIFTGPALSTLELFTPVDRLPHAMAILTITGNLIYALEPVVVDIIDYLGAPITFMVGGVAVSLSGCALKKNSLGLFRQSADREPAPSVPETSKSAYGLIFFLGLSSGIATAVLFNLLPPLLEKKLGEVFGMEAKPILVGILLLSALLSWPLSNVVNRYGLERIFRLSLVFISIATAGIYFSSSAVFTSLLTVAFAITFTSLSVAALPLAINRSSFSEKVFCVGIFFSGVALPQELSEILISR